MGSVIKCIAAYDTPFWRAAGMSGEGVSDAGPATMTFDDSPANGRSGALVAFLLGDAARHWSEQCPDERRSAVVAQLTTLFGDEAARPTSYVDKDWCVEPWSGGCYAGYMAPETASACAEVLRQPTGRIHWAGTETAVRWNGYLDGVIEAGERSADEVIEKIGAEVLLASS